MSTITNRKQKRLAEQALRPEKSANPTPQRKRKPLYLWGGILLAVVAVIALLPTLVAHTPLASYIVRRAAGLNATVSFRSASLGWFSGVSLAGVDIRDPQGEPILEAERFSIDRSLMKLMFASSNLGTMRLEKPKLSLAIQRDGSNVETAIAPWLTPSSSSSQGVDMTFEVADGEMVITDSDSHQGWHLNGLQLSLDMSKKLSQPTRLEAVAAIDDAKQPGTIAIKSHAQPGVDNTADGDISLQTRGMPLVMLQRIAARWMPGMQLAGTLDTNLESQWSGGSKSQIKGDVSAIDFALAHPTLGHDVLRLNHVHATCQALQQGQQIDVADLKLETEAGNLTASGRLDLGEHGITGLADLLRQPDCSLRGDVDLARLARILPNTLRIRPGMEITSGDIKLTAHAGQTPVGAAAPGSPGGTTWQAHVETGRLTATDHGRQIHWDKPMLIDLAAHQTAQGPFIDNLLCDSDFLRITGSGPPDKISAKVAMNLGKLTEELGRFVDFGGCAFTGDGDGTLQWNRTTAGDFATSGQLQIRGFQASIPGRQPWIEDSMTVGFEAKGRSDLAAQMQLQDAVVQFRSASDQVDVRLMQPLPDLKTATAVPFDIQMKGHMDRWPGRLALAALQEVRMSGGYAATAQVVAAKDSFTVNQLKITADHLSLNGPKWNWSEAASELTASGRFDFATNRLQLSTVQLAGSTLALNAKDIDWLMPKTAPWQVTGTVNYQGELEKLQPWIVAATGAAGMRYAGQINGTAQLRQTNGQIECRSQCDIDRLAIVDPTGKTIQEPRVHCVVQCSYQTNDGMLKIDQCELTSGLAGAKAAGEIALAPPGNVQLNGNVSYQWDKLNVLLQPYLGSAVQFSGAGTSPAFYRGPLSLARGEGGAEIRFSSAIAYGFQLGSGEIRARLANSVVQFDPIDVACNQGRIALAPQLRLDKTPMEFRMSAGTLARQIQLDAAACRSALMYVAPVLASVTQSQGQFSIVLDGCRVPLGDMARAEIAGRMIVHQAAVNPGPLVQQMTSLLMTPPSIVTIKPESAILFRVTGGRVYHQGLELQFPELTVTTYGSVGMDDSLKIMLQMNVPPRWLAGTPVGDAIKRQVVQIPIGGTLKRPQIDQAEIGRVSRQVLGNATRNVLQGEIGNQLNRFLGPGK